MESLVGIHRYLQAVQVHTVVGLKQLLHIGVLVSLHLLRRETLTAEVLKGLVPYGIHRLWGMIKDHLPSLLVEFYVLLFCVHLFLVYGLQFTVYR